MVSQSREIVACVGVSLGACCVDYSYLVNLFAYFDSSHEGDFFVRTTLLIWPVRGDCALPKRDHAIRVDKGKVPLPPTTNQATLVAHDD